jgi:hypothetical protein
VARPTDIDRLIELGLNRYGAGDVDSALLFWEEALAIDPDNTQANSYVDYVRQNYELITSGEPEVTDGGPDPFGIEEEPEYHIEVVPGQLSPRPSESSIPTFADVDAGWDIEGPAAGDGAGRRAHARARPDVR